MVTIAKIDDPSTVAHITSNLTIKQLKQALGEAAANDASLYRNVHVYANGRNHEITSTKEWEIAKKLICTEESFITLTFDVIIGGVSRHFMEGPIVDTSQGFVSDLKLKKT